MPLPSLNQSPGKPVALIRLHFNHHLFVLKFTIPSNPTGRGAHRASPVALPGGPWSEHPIGRPRWVMQSGYLGALLAEVLQAHAVALPQPSFVLSESGKTSEPSSKFTSLIPRG